LKPKQTRIVTIAYGETATMQRLRSDYPKRTAAKFTMKFDGLAWESEADGWRTVDLMLETEDYACRYVLGFGPRMIVLEPPALRERVLASARATLELIEWVPPRESECGPRKMETYAKPTH